MVSVSFLFPSFSNASFFRRGIAGLLVLTAVMIPTVLSAEAYHTRQLLERVPTDSPAVPVAVPLGAAQPPLEFYEGLQPGLPGLEAVYRAVARRDLAGAQAAFAAYLRARPSDRAVLQVLPPMAEGSSRTERGDAAAGGRITLLGTTHDYQGAIDWVTNPTSFSDWLLLLNRQGHWRDLAIAFEETGNPLYVRAFAEQLDSWLVGAPLPGLVAQAQARSISRERGHRRPFDPAWRTIEIGERLRSSWPAAFGAFVRQPSLDDATLVRMVAAMVRQADFLMEFQGPQNWFAIENEGLLRVAVLFPEFSRARVWKDEALGRISDQLETEVYPDGSHEELTFWYQETVRGAVAGIISLADSLGLDISPLARERFEGLHLSTMAVAQPDGRAPQVNDADPLRVELILRDGARRFNRPEMTYVATRGREGVAPDFLSTSLPWAGWAVLRTDWTERANYLFFEAGPFGGHAHEDKLGFILFAHGEPFVIDTGRSAYGESAWRSFNLGPKAHSTVLFDGKGQSRRYWRDNRLAKTEGEAEGFEFVTTPEVDYASGAFGEMRDEIFYDYELGFAFMTHRRTILFLKPDRWVVIDSFSGREGHPEADPAKVTPASFRPERMTTLFQLNDLPVELRAAGQGLIMGSPAGPRVNLSWTPGDRTSAEVVRGRAEPDLLGWRFLAMNDGNRPVPIPTLVLERELSNSPPVNAYLFSASAPGEPVRAERITLATKDSDSFVYHLIGAEGVFARITFNPNGADAPGGEGPNLRGRTVLDWKGEQWVFP